MCFGEFNHAAELGTESLTVSEVSGLYGKPSFAVNVDYVRLIDTRCVGLAFGLGHVFGPRSIKLMPYVYRIRVGSASVVEVSRRRSNGYRRNAASV